MKFVRPKFSLRLALLAIALSSVALYVFIARPTMLANQFAAAIANKDYAAARALTVDTAAWDRVLNPPNSTKADRLFTDILPREWRDLLTGKRRIMLVAERRMHHQGAYVDWSEGIDVIAHIHGIEVMPSHFPGGIASELPPGPPVVRKSK